jgi:hypothetical protein
VLGDFSKPGLEIVLDGCEITSAGASALAEVLGRNQGPTKLDWCKIDNSALADGLRGNSRLKVFRAPTSRNSDIGNQELLAIAGALRENKGIVDVEIRPAFRMNIVLWGAICDALKTHPTLEVLSLGCKEAIWTSPTVIKSRMQVLVDMLKVNTLIHTIHLDAHYSQHRIFRKSVIRHLDTNRFRPRLLAIQRTRPIPYRAKVLGRALLSARTDANRFWMILSGNAEVAFPSRITTIAVAANLPTPATAAATSTANVAAVAASVMSALTTTAIGSLPTADAVPTTAASAVPPSSPPALDASAPEVATAANVATSFAGQKRKAGANPTRDGSI